MWTNATAIPPALPGLQPYISTQICKRSKHWSQWMYSVPMFWSDQAEGSTSRLVLCMMSRPRRPGTWPPVTRSPSSSASRPRR